ncbi:MAG TPA: protein-export chaperone SecB [Acholeplasmataceae bacterium]|jgi:preprotein translocase subunit SecB|nr:protein-export chaperone SecB [Acholeplasmataceae bacterium]HRX44452.1 protein-export chaperone SecB [Acholeplasmataceae bacterium]
MKIKNTMIQADRIILHNTGILGDNFKLNPSYEKEIYKDQVNAYILKLFVAIKNTDENPFPVSLEVCFTSRFEFEDAKDENEIMTYLNINAIQMVFPYIRAGITNVFSAALLPPLVLPIIDVRNFKDRVLV